MNSRNSNTTINCDNSYISLSFNTYCVDSILSHIYDSSGCSVFNSNESMLLSCRNCIIINSPGTRLTNCENIYIINSRYVHIHGERDRILTNEIMNETTHSNTGSYQRRSLDQLRASIRDTRYLLQRHISSPDIPRLSIDIPPYDIPPPRIPPPRIPPPPLMETDLRNILSRRAQYEDISDMCSVCHNNLETTERLLVLSCNHIFHTECVLRWINSRTPRNLSCPNCRERILLE
jgi:hypothetical protein